MNPEAEEQENQQEYPQDAIGSTLFSKTWLMNTLNNQVIDEHDLESISEMACDDEVAEFLASQNVHFKLLSLLLPQKQSSPRSQELALVVLTNMMRSNFQVLKHESTCLQIPLNILPMTTDVQVLLCLYQYLTIVIDQLNEEDFEEGLCFEHLF